MFFQMLERETDVSLKPAEAATPGLEAAEPEPFLPESVTVESVIGAEQFPADAASLLGLAGSLKAAGPMADSVPEPHPAAPLSAKQESPEPPQEGDRQLLPSSTTPQREEEQGSSEEPIR